MDLDTDTESPMLHPAPTSTRKLKQYCAAISVSLGALCAGTCLAWSSPALAQLSVTANSTESFHLTDSQGAAVGGMIAIGALISAIPAGFLADKFGRKNVIFALSLTFLLNWILIIFAQNVTTLIIGRIFAGIGTGAICVVGPIYIGEIAEKSTRGVLGALINMFLCSGILLTCVFGSFTTWRVLSMILGTVPVIFGGSFLFMPETPVYLVKAKNLEKAEKTLIEFRRSNHDINTELKEIQREVEASQQNAASIRDVFTSKANRRAFMSVVAVLAFQQLCGVNAVVFYTVPIFQAAGSSLRPDLVGIIIGLVQVLSAYVSLLVIEKANRKFYLMLSSVGMLLFLTALGMYFHLKSLNVDISHLSFLPIGSAVMFMVSFSFGYGPIPWLLMGELFAPEIKGVGNGFAIATNWSCAFLVTYFFPIIKSGLGAHVAFYICAGINALATVYVGFVVPETRGKTLLDIQQILNK
ncbi:facilitated trehalose transporter Tret1 [Tribolium castaneum]|uniref:Facilitated trehalose transporter Tret1-1-like Protein n=1 Tax=Tribolium castaneum TaxID=7070 RepID=D6X387_TRICA|nr:PREDICTED: facilitated trehalose transporter Tret1 isoform X1 [Tribolium castaneum]EFA10347.1 Facilitated trehalose transporter Tret1-1-like Protein [Tribolium castaneum]|eukprot:XP_966866.3 PREDICTED: facilitated trehalose transporter Tret1 isoform X1 [Tribolium castaneum]